MHDFRRFKVLFLIYVLLHSSVSAIDYSYKEDEDSISIRSENLIKKAIYPRTSKRSGIYNLIVGKHYRELYCTPISVKTTGLYNLYGGLSFVNQLPRLHALFFETKDSHLYMVRPLGGATTFLESDFFQNIYNKQEFRGTYLDRLIGDAYTITHPYAFVVANELAGKIGVSSFDSEIYYVLKHLKTDTIADGTGVEDRLISVYDLKEYTLRSKIIETEELLTKIQESKLYYVDQHQYVRERLLDILIGDWNKTRESWQWYENAVGDSLVYMPLIADRSHAFTKIDGKFLKLMLGALGLGGITNYSGSINNLEKANEIGIPLDVALVARSRRDVWHQEAKYIKSVLTNEVIDEAFKLLPEEIYVSSDTELIKNKLKRRRDLVEVIAQKYYNILQKTPVILGTHSDDLFVIDQQDKRTTNIRLYDRNTEQLLFDKKYDKKTKEIWLYGLKGDDSFKVLGVEKGIPLTLVGGKGVNTYSIEGGKSINIYDYKSHSLANDTLDKAKIVKTDVEKVHEYDYTKLKYKTLDFTPWGVYDSDLGLYLGAYLTTTMYGFKRSPYSYQHRIGYSYLDGLMYQGFFPSLDERRGFNIEAIFGIANDFHNFFGYGNQTEGFKDKSADFNRVDMARYSLEPSYYWKFDSANKLIASTMFELYNVERSTDRFINEIYKDDASVFGTKVFMDFNLTYQMHRELNALVPSVDFSITSGLNWTINDPNCYFPYLSSSLSFEIACGDRLSFLTEILGTALFSDHYQFYQAASVELRGFRESRFIGKQSLLQHTDLRYDLGHLKNPFTPIQYGVFVGVDHGRVWYPGENSSKWHLSYGGGWWLTLFKEYTGKFSYFGSKDGSRFLIGLGMGF